MRTPISYYGGKQRLIPEILPLMPRHTQYVEAFCGGAAVFFAKNPSENEVINDMDSRLTNFYWQIKTNFEELQTLIRATLHSEIHYQNAEKVLEDVNETPVRRAWAYWVRTQMAFSYILGGGFAFGQDRRSGQNSDNKRNNFNEQYKNRMNKVEVFNRDAVDLIKLKDGPDTLFFCDPPYVSSDQGGYKGYTKEHFIALLDTFGARPPNESRVTRVSGPCPEHHVGRHPAGPDQGPPTGRSPTRLSLATIKGKFILSSYPEKELMEYREKYGWGSKDIKQIVGVSGKREGVKYKTECITFNFIPPNHQPDLFDQIDTQHAQTETSTEIEEEL